MKQKTIIVIGGGPAGIMAASTAAQSGANVILLEQNNELGKKMAITGNGRCNITNDCNTSHFIDNVLRNPRFLHTAINQFNGASIRAILKANGLDTKVADDGRVFPATDDAKDVIRALSRHLNAAGAATMLNAKVSDVSDVSCTSNADIAQNQPPRFDIKLEDGRVLNCHKLIIATGGLSYPQTGSRGDGYNIAKALGHGITKLHPSAVPLAVSRPDFAPLMGLCADNVAIVAKLGKRQAFRGVGSIIFTHFGISGPLVLDASGHLAGKLLGHDFYLDFAPALNLAQLDSFMLKIFGQNLNKSIKNCLQEHFAASLIAFLLRLADINKDTKVSEISKKARLKLIGLIKCLDIDISGTLGFGAAVATCGGVSCKEINPQTMESKIVPGLYFAGEIMDVDAKCGGYNMTIALSTGYMAGKGACQ